jgi:hypothetical protein
MFMTLVSPVFWAASVELGGYGFKPIQISYFLGGIGISQAFWLVVVFPPLQQKIGTDRILRFCLYAWPIFFASCPMCNTFLRRGWTTAFWIVAPILQVGGSGVAMAFSEFVPILDD